MIKHSLSVIKAATNFLNPIQIPIATFEQPLYTIATCVQWNWLHTLDESKFLMMLGWLHIEMAALKAIGS